MTKEEKDAFINVIELALDYGMKVSSEDLALYHKLTDEDGGE